MCNDNGSKSKLDYIKSAFGLYGFFVIIHFQNPFASQEHYISTESSIPIVVYENEPTSIVAFTLNSAEYKRSLEEMAMKRGQSSEQSPSPIARRKSNNDKDKIDEDKPMNLLGFLRNKESKTDLYNQSSTSSSEAG